MRIRCAVTVLGLLLAVLMPVHGQEEAQRIEGARDFRTAPVLVDGAYEDVILTGEALWYGLYITNDPDNVVDVTVRLGDEPIRADWRPQLELVGPTLGTVARSPAGDPLRLRAERLWYGRSGDGESWLWFLKLTLDSDGRRGEEVPVELEVSGTAEVDTRPCEEVPGCDLHDRIAQLEESAAQLRAVLAGGPPQPAEAGRDDDLAVLRSERDDLVAQVEALGAARDRDRSVGRWGTAQALTSAAGGLLMLAAGLLLARGSRHRSTTSHERSDRSRRRDQCS